nr:integrase, catalytic region, zinc finger, CCHC-type, peptidase aspartic, catalytic [Tanacetum cinerariifolium]
MLVLSTVAVEDLHLEQLHVKIDFLHGDLDEDIYMTQSEGFLSARKEENLVCKLKKSLYGLKQTLRQWYLNFDSFMQKDKFTSGKCWNGHNFQFLWLKSNYRESLQSASKGNSNISFTRSIRLKTVANAVQAEATPKMILFILLAAEATPKMIMKIIRVKGLTLYHLKSHLRVIQLILWIVDNGCSKHMTCNLKLLRNFVEKLMGTVRFGNYSFATITGYEDYVQSNLTICHVYYVKGLRHNLFSIEQFCDGDLEVAFRSNTCYVRNLEGKDLLTGSRDSNLYTISIFGMAASSPICLMSKATLTKSWLWHRRLSHLNFDTINYFTKQDLVDGISKFKYDKDHQCSACEQEKSKKATLSPKLVPSTKSKLGLIHMDLCGPMQENEPNTKIGIFIGYFESSRWFRIYNRRTRKIMKTIHVKYDELTAMDSECSNSGLDNSVAHTLDNEDTPSFSSIIVEDHEAPQLVSSSEESISNEPITSVSDTHSDEQVQEDVEELDGNTFINPFRTLAFEEAESSSNYHNPSNMHEFHQQHRFNDRWTKNNPIELPSL